jgi:hypothetical protein
MNSPFPKFSYFACRNNRSKVDERNVTKPTEGRFHLNAVGKEEASVKTVFEEISLTKAATPLL